MRSGQRLTVLFAVGAVAALAVVVVTLVSRASSSDDGGGSASGAADAAAVRVAQSKLGRILVDAHGRTLYLFVADTHGTSTCSESCARLWPPLHASGKPSAGPGVRAGLLGTVRRADGTEQVVYHGHPLYLMVADERPGQTQGQAWNGTWFVVSPAGDAITNGAKVATGGY